MRMIAGTAWPVEDARTYIMDRVHQVPWSGCWLWDAGIDRDGYGRTSMPRSEGKKRHVHRIAYDAFVGPIPSGMYILHSCDVPACCNPDHLRPGTAAENAADSIRRRRKPCGENHPLRKDPSRCARGADNGAYTKPQKRPRGESHGCARLTLEQVVSGRVRFSQGLVSARALAKEWRVSVGHTYNVLRGRSWRDARP